jgi:hypothetical protein
MKEKKELVEVWEDLVSLRDLFLASLIGMVTTGVAYWLAPERGSMPLFFGLGGALLGFAVSSFLIRPKRIFE